MYPQDGWIIYLPEKGAGGVLEPEVILGSRFKGKGNNQGVISQCSQDRDQFAAQRSGAFAMMCHAARDALSIDDFKELLHRKSRKLESINEATSLLMISYLEGDGDTLYEALLQALHQDQDQDQDQGVGRHTVAEAGVDRFFHVAIDCPGYGRSIGDCQTIRSYPGEFLSEIVKNLGKKHAYALVGSSQGLCIDHYLLILNLEGYYT